MLILRLPFLLLALLFLLANKLEIFDLDAANLAIFPLLNRCSHLILLAFDHRDMLRTILRVARYFSCPHKLGEGLLSQYFAVIDHSFGLHTKHAGL